MACQQTRKGGYKSEGKYTKPHPRTFLTLKCNYSVKDVGMDKALYFLPSLLCPPLFVLFLACHLYISSFFCLYTSYILSYM